MRRSNTFKATSVEVGNVAGTAVPVGINGRPFMIANTGVQPLYINPAATATASNGFLVPAGSVLPIKFTVQTNLSVISNATGTTYAVMYFDL